VASRDLDPKARNSGRERIAASTTASNRPPECLRMRNAWPRAVSEAPAAQNIPNAVGTHQQACSRLIDVLGPRDGETKSCLNNMHISTGGRGGASTVPPLYDTR